MQCSNNGLPSSYEEADTRVILHAVYAQTDNAIAYASYTDVLLLLLAYSPKTRCSNIWMMEGTSKRENVSLSGMRWAVYLVIVRIVCSHFTLPPGAIPYHLSVVTQTRLPGYLSRINTSCSMAYAREIEQNRN